MNAMVLRKNELLKLYAKIKFEKEQRNRAPQSAYLELHKSHSARNVTDQYGVCRDQ